MKITGLSKKTKAELLETVKIVQEAYQELKELFEKEKEEYELQKENIKTLEASQKKFKAELTDLKKHANSNKKKDSEQKKLRQEVKKLTSLNEALSIKVDEYEKLLGDHQAKLSEAGKNEEKIKVLSSLFDLEKKARILVDSKYIVQYVNDKATLRLSVMNNEELRGKRIFSLFDYQNGMKLKEKIDAAFVEGEEKKFKDVCYSSANGRKVKMKGKMKPTCFKGNPAIVIVLSK